MQAGKLEMPESAPRIHYFTDTEGFARDLSKRAGVGASRVRVHEFPDGESSVRVRGPAGRHAWLVRTLHQPNAKLVEVALAADALRRAGSERVTLVAPYLPYMRQDKVFAPGEAISQRVIASWIAKSFDGLATLEPHLHRLHSLTELIPGAISLSAAPLFADWVRSQPAPLLLVGPDEESEPWVRAIAGEAGCEWIVGQKRRSGDRSVRVRFDHIPSLQRALIVDDIASTGMTLASAAEALREGGVRRVEAAVVHAIFSRGALGRIRAGGVRRCFSCDSIPHRSNQLSSAGLFARALTRDLG
jgi:ribose-phosphate pyrophosphokinase